MIEVKNLSFGFGKKKVLEGVNFTVAEGAVTGLVGINGAGKTTLIKLLTRLYDPTEGRILLDGRDVREYNVEELYKLCKEKRQNAKRD